MLFPFPLLELVELEDPFPFPELELLRSRECELLVKELWLFPDCVSFSNDDDDDLEDPLPFPDSVSLKKDDPFDDPLEDPFEDPLDELFPPFPFPDLHNRVLFPLPPFPLLLLLELPLPLLLLLVLVSVSLLKRRRIPCLRSTWALECSLLSLKSLRIPNDDFDVEFDPFE